MLYLFTECISKSSLYSTISTIVLRSAYIIVFRFLNKQNKTKQNFHALTHDNFITIDPLLGFDLLNHNTHLICLKHLDTFYHPRETSMQEATPIRLNGFFPPFLFPLTIYMHTAVQYV